MPGGVIKIDARRRKIARFKKALDDSINQWEIEKNQAPLRAFIRDLNRDLISIRREVSLGVQEIIYFKIKKDAFDKLTRKHLS
jgi:hypothetical protein